MAEIKKCPFCGGTSEVGVSPARENFAVMCMKPKCEAQGSIKKSRAMAIKSWNKVKR